MIQPLRSAHRRVFIALAVLLPAIMTLGLSVRHPRVRPSIRVVQLAGSAHLVRKSGTLWSKGTIETEFYEDSNHPGEVSVVMHPATERAEPDLLLYWSQVRPTSDSLPAPARLVGPFLADRAFALPLTVERAGFLVLFSLPHHAVVDAARVEKLP